MSIDVRKFINVNIDYSKRPVVISQRDTAVLVTDEGIGELKTNVFVSSKQEWLDYAESGTFIKTTPYVNTFFDHGGVNLLIITNGEVEDVLELDDKYIVVAIVGQDLSEIKTLATSLDLRKGVHRKLLVARVEYDDIYINTAEQGQPEVITYSDPQLSGFNSLAIKYSSEIGAEMAIAAYLTRVNIYGSNTVKDYTYTVENIKYEVAHEINNTLYDLLQSLNFNFNINLAGANRNIGGNLTNGRVLINEFMLIVLHQTVTDNLLLLLMSKLKGNKALASMRGVISQELENYVRNGYLDTNKIWDNEDWNVTHNGENFTIVKKGTPLNLGYLIQVLPWTALNESDKQLKKAPPIYIVLADSYGIRQIEVTGEVV